MQQSLQQYVPRQEAKVTCIKMSWILLPLYQTVAVNVRRPSYVNQYYQNYITDIAGIYRRLMQFAFKFVFIISDYKSLSRVDFGPADQNNNNNNNNNNNDDNNNSNNNSNVTQICSRFLHRL